MAFITDIFEYRKDNASFFRDFSPINRHSAVLSPFTSTVASYIFATHILI